MACLTQLQNKFKDYCEYANSCRYFRSDSYTCTHSGGGPYCGEWRKRKGLLKNE